MISDLDEKRQSDLLFYTKLSIITKYLPEIINHLIKKNTAPTDVALQIIMEEKIRLTSKQETKLIKIFNSAPQKGMYYKTFKKMLKLQLEKKKQEKKLYFKDKDEIEYLLVKSNTLFNTLNELKYPPDIIEKKQKDKLLFAKEYIETMLSKEEQEITRRKK